MTIYYLKDYRPEWSRELMPEGALRDRRVFILPNVSKFLGLRWFPHYTDIKKHYPSHEIISFGVTARRQMDNLTDWEVDVDIQYEPKTSKVDTKTNGKGIKANNKSKPKKAKSLGTNKQSNC
jgi:hypothetical protein